MQFESLVVLFRSSILIRAFILLYLLCIMFLSLKSFSGGICSSWNVVHPVKSCMHYGWFKSHSLLLFCYYRTWLTLERWHVCTLSLDVPGAYITLAVPAVKEYVLLQCWWALNSVHMNYICCEEYTANVQPTASQVTGALIRLYSYVCGFFSCFSFQLIT